MVNGSVSWGTMKNTNNYAIIRSEVRRGVVYFYVTVVPVTHPWTARVFGPYDSYADARKKALKRCYAKNII